MAPKDDREAKIVGRWADDVAEAFSCTTRSIRTRDAATSALLQYQHLMYFGHGKRDALVARHGFRRKLERICDEANIAQAGRVVIAVACWSGDQLGRQLTGCSGRVGAYLGWIDDVSIPRDDGPLREAVTSGLKALATGATVWECAIVMRSGFEKAHEFYHQHDDNHLTKMQVSYWAQRMFIGGDLGQRL
jgi:hypothetical protein